MSSKYVPAEFEGKLIEKWGKDQVYAASNQSPVTSNAKPHFAEASRGKQYILSMFPYPSGAGLHVGHVRIYTGTDILARYFRMKGFSVLHPMGWDAFGLPAENAAIKAKKNPMDMVPDNIATFKRQMQSLGLSYDWSREFATTDPEYYKWTQWLFLQLYSVKNKNGEQLLYRSQAPIKWCPSCKTGLANEEVLSDGTHERCHTVVEEKSIPQWMFRITDYAERLLSDLQGLDWPRGIIEMQKNWIGKKEGMIIHHKVDGMDYTLDTFTAYPQWSFADTFIVVAPEHPFVKEILNSSTVNSVSPSVIPSESTDESRDLNTSSSVIPAKAGIYTNRSPIESRMTNDSKLKEIESYLESIKQKTQADRMSEDKEKTGVFTGFYAIDPFRPNEKMPIWIANFALMDFGTGAVRCSIHDPRDVAFAKKYNIKLRTCVIGDKGEYVHAHDNKGILVDSGPFTGKEVGEIIPQFIEWVENEKIGEKKTTFHLRDWIFSRQRYWGEPFPLVYCEKCGDENGVVPVPDDQLPIELPYVASYEPTETGESPLSQITDWVNTTCPDCGGPARRETDTMPNWAGSCWYFIYFARKISDGQNFLGSELAFNRDARTSTPGENFNQSSKKAVSIENWKLKIENSASHWLAVDWYLGGAEHAVLHLLYARFWIKVFKDLGLVDFTEPFSKLRGVGMVLAADNRKMSKSYGNVINPDDVVKEYGADTLRVYEAFIAPFSQEVAWSTRAVQGSYRFLSRIWQIYHNSASITEDPNQEDEKLVAKLQSTILKITSDITNVKFNTSIAAMMEFLNEWETVAGPASSSSQKMLVGAAPLSGLPPDSSPATKKLSSENAKVFLQLLAPFAPFIAEELWSTVLGETSSIHLSTWPTADESVLKNQSINLAVQVNGKVRTVISVQPEAPEDEVVAQALKDEKVIKYLNNQPYKTIYVPGRILNIVLR